MYVPNYLLFLEIQKEEEEKNPSSNKQLWKNESQSDTFLYYIAISLSPLAGWYTRWWERWRKQWHWWWLWFRPLMLKRIRDKTYMHVHEKKWMCWNSHRILYLYCSVQFSWKYIYNIHSMQGCAFWPLIIVFLW